MRSSRRDGSSSDDSPEEDRLSESVVTTKGVSYFLYKVDILADTCVGTEPVMRAALSV
jgi:hypothetical protein